LSRGFLKGSKDQDGLYIGTNLPSMRKLGRRGSLLGNRKIIKVVAKPGDQTEGFSERIIKAVSVAELVLWHVPASCPTVATGEVLSQVGKLSQVQYCPNAKKMGQLFQKYNR
jgi:hypothetical protein